MTMSRRARIPQSTSNNSALSRPLFRFSNYELVTARREVLRDGESLPVEPKVYDLLLFLVERRERTVSKDELQDAIWPNVVVTESALTRCIMKTRQLVGDDAKRQSIIKTVQKGGYRFVADVECTHPDQQALAQSTASRERVSIAVLPFANLSGASEQDYLADGLTQDVSTDLSRNAWMFVISHRTMQSFASKDVDRGQIAAELGIQYVVEGSVRRSGDKIRVTASLVDAHTGVSEWSERYDREVEDLFEIQDDIGSHIVSSTGSHVRRAEGRRAERADPAALDVWGLLHRGMSISWSRFSRESNSEAEALYRQALQIEPDNARAKAFLANSIAMKVSNGWSGKPGCGSVRGLDSGQRGKGLPTGRRVGNRQCRPPAHLSRQSGGRRRNTQTRMRARPKLRLVQGRARTGANLLRSG